MKSVLDVAEKVAVSSDLYAARTAVIELTGEKKFKENVDGFRPILRGLCEKNGITEMEATIEILGLLRGKGTESMLAMAACIEIMEPSLGL